MSNEESNGGISNSWEEAARNRPRRTEDAVGKRCAALTAAQEQASEDDYQPENHEFLCFECAKGNTLPVYHHGPVEHQLRYLYILKISGGKYYIGQTNDIELRLQEHRDGLTRSTVGKNPQLVYFEEWRGRKEALIDVLRGEVGFKKLSRNS